MTVANRLTDTDDEDSLLRPAWEETADETDADRGVYRGQPDPACAPDQGSAVDGLLSPLCAATDALARLDARAAGAHLAVRGGLIARMAYTEAAGFLAHTHAWVHPLDLALRELGLTASTALAATGGHQRALPHTFAVAVNTSAWADPPLDELPAGDAAVTEALALAGALRRLVDQCSANTRVTAAMMARGAAGARHRRAGSGWPRNLVERHRATEGEPATPIRRTGRAGGCPTSAAAARRGTHRPELDRGRPCGRPDPGAGALARRRGDGPHRHTACGGPACLGRLSRARLRRPQRPAQAALGCRRPACRLGIAGQLAARFPPSRRRQRAHGPARTRATRGGAEKGRELVARVDQRSRLPDAIDALLRAPVLTSTALAAKLMTAPQTATALLRELQGKGIVREVTGRGRFRAYAI